MSDVLRYETLGYSGDPTNSNSEKEMNHDQLRRQLQNMELELSSVIGSLKSNASLSEKVYSATRFCYQRDILHMLDFNGWYLILSFPLLELDKDLNKVKDAY